MTEEIEIVKAIIVEAPLPGRAILRELICAPRDVVLAYIKDLYPTHPVVEVVRTGEHRHVNGEIVLVPAMMRPRGARQLL